MFIKCPSSSSLQELAVASINDEQSKHGGTGSVPGMGRFAGKKSLRFDQTGDSPSLTDTPGAKLARSKFTKFFVY